MLELQAQVNQNTKFIESISEKTIKNIADIEFQKQLINQLDEKNKLLDQINDEQRIVIQNLSEKILQLESKPNTGIINLENETPEQKKINDS